MQIRIGKRSLDQLPVTDRKSGTRYTDQDLRGFSVVKYPSGRVVYFVAYGGHGGPSRLSEGWRSGGGEETLRSRTDVSGLDGDLHGRGGASKEAPPQRPALSRDCSDLKKPWAALQKTADLPDVHVHDLRRTFGLHVARRVGIHVASRLLRHSVVRVTQRHYAPLGLDDLREALEVREAEIVPLRKSRDSR